MAVYSTPGQPYFTVGHTYDSKNNKDWQKTGYVTKDLDPTIPSGVYLSYLSQNGLGGTDRKSDFAQGMYSKMQSGWQAAMRVNPSLTFLDYLHQQLGNGAGGIQAMWAGAAPSERGEQPSLWAGPARTIGWG